MTELLDPDDIRYFRREMGARMRAKRARAGFKQTKVWVNGETHAIIEELINRGIFKSHSEAMVEGLRRYFDGVKNGQIQIGTR